VLIYPTTIWMRNREFAIFKHKVYKLHTQSAEIQKTCQVTITEIIITKTMITNVTISRWKIMFHQSKNKKDPDAPKSKTMANMKRQ